MKLISKYGLGDQVWYVAPPRRITRDVPCDLCDSQGVLALAGKDRRPICPDCFGRRVVARTSAEAECVIESRTIGLVRVERRVDRPSTEVEYMAHESGIGSGALLPEDRLYSTRAEAEAAARVLEATAAADRAEEDGPDDASPWHSNPDDSGYRASMADSGRSAQVRA